MLRDGRDRIEVVESLIAASNDEEDKEDHRMYLKLCHPQATTGGHEKAWDKRDLVYLYEDIGYLGSPEGTRMLSM